MVVAQQFAATNRQAKEALEAVYDRVKCRGRGEEWRVGNWLTINITHEESELGVISIYAEVFVDRERWADYLDIEVFFEALENSGHHPLFTCGCGVFGCGGYYVDVECAENEWIWRNKYDPQGDEVIAEFEYRFSWRYVYEVATKVRDYIRDLLKHNPGAKFRTGVSGTFDVNVVFAGNNQISLREAKGGVDQEMFDRYMAIVEAEAQRMGKVFYFNCEESSSVLWEEMGLEMARLSGWLLEPEEVTIFDRFYDKKDESAEYYMFASKYYPKMRDVSWEVNKEGVLAISFGEEEGV